MAKKDEKAASSTCSAFFSNIPYTTSAGYLRKVFGSAGRVKDLELYTDPYGTSIGAGVVYFDSASEAARAVSELHDREVDGRLMLVKSNERDGRPRGSGGNSEATVFFNGVPYGTTARFLQAKFERQGKIVDFDLWRRQDGSSQGMGTCEFSDAAEAAKAISGLNGTIVDGRMIVVQMDSRPEGSGDGPPKASPRRSSRPSGKAVGKGHPDRRVFWSGVPATTTEGYLRFQFEKLGTIVDFDFWRRPDGSSLGMGVCEFDHYLGAWRAHERLNQMDIDGGTLLIKNDDGGRAKGAGGKGKGTKGTGKGWWR